MSRRAVGSAPTAGLCGAFEGKPEMGPRCLGQELQGCAVGVGELSRDVKAEARAAGPGGEEGLEDLAAQLRRDARAIVAHLADHGVAHVAGARGDSDAALLLL